MDLDVPRTLFITCFRGLAPWLRREVEALGYTVRHERATGLEVAGSLRDAMELNLHLRTALNVLVLLKSFRARTPDHLYKRVRSIPWEEWLSPEETLTVVSHCKTPAVDNTMFANVRVKDAVADRMMEAEGRRPDAGPGRDGFVLALYWNEDRCRLYWNTSGRKIADRGYRRLPHKAPLREPLAAAIVMATGYDGSAPFVNPMCGSGTLAIEAALMAAGRAPGLLRDDFGILHGRGVDRAVWEELRKKARLAKHKDAPAPIVATDHDPQAVEAARKNAATAGVERLIEFSVCDVADTPMPGEGGAVVLNPEYGERLGEGSELEATYGRIGDFFKQRCAGRTGFVFTGNLDLAKKIGLRARRRHVFWNAKIECRLLEYELYAGSRR